MRSSQQKLKLMYLAKILLERTDEENAITVREMIDALDACGISAERKSIYDDVECLKQFGLDICSVKNSSTGYFVASREFELPELKLLVDSVQSSKFITHKKSMELISKIEKLTSNHNARKLDRQVFVSNRVKTYNEQIYYNVDKIHEAIAADRKIQFRYFDLDLDKRKVYRKEGETYTETPVALSWDDENYYLIVYKEKYSSFAHYRVDKMDNINVSEDTRDRIPENFDLSDYTKTVFSMFGGEQVAVTVEFDNRLVGVVFDRFGVDVPIIKSGSDHFRCTVKVAVSPQFFSWVMGFGNRARIISPDYVVEEQKKLLAEISENY